MDAGDARSGRRARGLNGAAAYSLSSAAARPFSRQYDHEDSRPRRERSPFLASSRLGRSRERSPYLSKTKERRLRGHSPFFSRSPLGLGYGRSQSPSAALYRKRSPLGLGYARSPSPYLLPRARSPLGLGYSRSRSPFLPRARSPLWLEAGRARSPLGLGFSRSLSPTSRLYYDLDLLRYERLTRGPYPYRSPPRPRRRRSRSPRYPPPVNSRPSRGPPAAAKERPRPRRPQLYHLKLTKFPAHCSDESVRQGLQHAFKKHGPLARLTLQGSGDERYALLGYGRAKERAEALAANAAGAQLFGAELAVAAVEGPEAGLTDEEVALRREASMTLYVGNLDKETSTAALTAAFSRFGEVLFAEIKVARHNYGFVQFADILSVARAIRAMNGRPLGRNKVALGFGKNLPTACVWLCGLKHTGLTAKALLRHFRHYGSVLKLLHDTKQGTALVLFKDRYSASVAVGKLRRAAVEGHRLKAVFASSRVQLAFCRNMQASGQDVGDFPQELARKAAADSQGGLNEEESAMVAEASDEEEEQQQQPPQRPVVAPASDNEEEAPEEDEDETPGEEEEEEEEEEEQEDDEEDQEDEEEEEQEEEMEEEDTNPPSDDGPPQGQDTDGPGPQDQPPADPQEPADDGPQE